MEKQPPRPMTPFDELITPPQLHMLKLFLPYTPSSNQKFLGVFVKFLELKEVITFFQGTGKDLHTQAFHINSPPSFMEIMQEIKPYMPSKESEMIDTFLNMMNIMEMAQMFQENPDSSPGGTGENRENQNAGGLSGLFSGGFNPMDMMMGMLTPEQQNMFQMYNNMFAGDMNANDTKENTEDTHDAANDMTAQETDADDMTMLETDTDDMTMLGTGADDITMLETDTDDMTMLETGADDMAAQETLADKNFNNWKGNQNYE